GASLAGRINCLNKRPSGQRICRSQLLVELSDREGTCIEYCIAEWHLCQIELIDSISDPQIVYIYLKSYEVDPGYRSS
ncbi:hypothetical protein GIB67_012577, partial [Kingdonia uniflora]